MGPDGSKLLFNMIGFVTITGGADWKVQYKSLVGR